MAKRKKPHDASSNVAKRKRQSLTFSDEDSAEADRAQAAAGAQPPPSVTGQNEAGEFAARCLALTAWLAEGSAKFDTLEVRSDRAACGLGAFALRDLVAGEVVFVVPQKLMLTLEAAMKDTLVASVAKSLQSHGEQEMPEFLMCLRLCRARRAPDDCFHAYAASMPDDSPGAASWPSLFRELLQSTTLGPSLEAADAELDRWLEVLQRMGDIESSGLGSDGMFSRSSLDWARGMVQSRQFPGGFGGTQDSRSLCMVPLLDALNHKQGADVSVRVRAGLLEFVCDKAVKAGEEIWNNYGDKGNDELLMCYGFAIEDNHCDKVSLALAPAAGSSSDACPSPAAIQLTAAGIPEEVVDFIEDAQDTKQFIALLQAMGIRRRAVKDCLKRLPVVLNFTVCKGAIPKARKRSIQAFLEGQLKVLDTCLEEMQSAKCDEEVGDQEDKEEQADDESDDNDYEVAVES